MKKIILFIIICFLFIPSAKAQENVRLDELPGATTLTGEEIIYLLQSSTDKNATLELLKAYVVSDSSVSMEKLTTAVINFIGSGGSITNNPDDVTLENKAEETIGIKLSYLYSIVLDTVLQRLIIDFADMDTAGRTSINRVIYYDSSAEKYKHKAENHKISFVLSPAVGDDKAVFNDAPFYLDTVFSVILGDTVQFNLKHSTDRSSGSPTTILGNTTETNKTTGSNYTSFTTALIPRGWLRYNTVAVGDSASQISITLKGRKQ